MCECSTCVEKYKRPLFDGCSSIVKIGAENELGQTEVRTQMSTDTHRIICRKVAVDTSKTSCEREKVFKIRQENIGGIGALFVNNNLEEKT